MRTKLLVKSTGMAIIALLLLTSCAVFPRNELSQVGSLQPLLEGSRKPIVEYTFSSGMDFVERERLPESGRAQLEQEFVDVLNESEYFASVSQGNQGEINILARLVDSAAPEAMIPVYLTGLTLGMIPCWVTSHFDVTAKVTAQDGKEHTYQLTDSSTLVIWLPLIVGAPFMDLPKVTLKEVRQNIWKNLILKMQEDGVLPKQ